MDKSRTQAPGPSQFQLVVPDLMQSAVAGSNPLSLQNRLAKR
ncbi:hypothetical protein R70199_08144 [Paraburkholderia domus]|nr:hypothetical protein R70199_08144 [Paraburkholderia domus]